MKPDRAKLAIRLVSSVLVFCGRLLDNRVVNALAHDYRRSVWSRKLGALGPDAAIYRWVAIHNAKKVRIGRLISIAEFCHVWGGGGVEIGDEVMIASHVTITSQSHFTDPTRRRAANDRPVTIGNRVWIGSHAVILPGVTIGDDSVIAAGAVVTKDVPTGSIVAGVPARVIGSCHGETV